MGSDLDRKLREIGQRGVIRRVVVEEEKPVDERSRPEQLALRLSKWASDDVCTDVFLPYLDELIAQAEAEEEAVIESHIKVAAALSRKKTLRQLREAFKTWAG